MYMFIVINFIWNIEHKYAQLKFFPARDVFRLLNTKYKKLELQVGASFFEIYSGKVRYLYIYEWIGFEKFIQF